LLAGIAPFIWGGPGIGKSAIVGQIATSQNKALVTVYLAQRDQTDLGGMPYPTVEHGVSGVRFSQPLILPRDIDVDSTVVVEHGRHTIRLFNPKGSNGIRVVKSYVASVEAVDDEQTATILQQNEDSFIIDLRDKNGRPATGPVRYLAHGDAEAIVFLDEFNCAPQSMQTAAYSFLLDGVIGEYVTPKGVQLVAAGNRDTDRGSTFKLPTPVINRVEHLELEVRFDDWKDFALDNNFHPAVIGYLMKFQDRLNISAGDLKHVMRGFNTPRSWEFASRILYSNDNESQETVKRLLIGVLGLAIGSEFTVHRELVKKLPDVSEVLNGNITKITKDIGGELLFSYTTSIIFRIKEEIARVEDDKLGDNDPRRLEVYRHIANFIKYIQTSPVPEVSVISMRVLLTTGHVTKLVRVIPEIREFAKVHNELWLTK
jgi:hypothetical protein